MKRINFHELKASEKEDIFTEVAAQKGIPPFAVEKDWWVVQTLAMIFQTSAATHLVFKGGTSLSKSWSLIQRFSEDIDLAIDRKFLGFDGELSKNQRTQLRKVANKYTSEQFFIELQSIFTDNGYQELEFKLVETRESDQDPRLIEVYYPNVTKSDGYIQPRIQIEIGCRSLIEPYTTRPITSFVDEIFGDKKFAGFPIEISSVNPERTFLEKLFLLHEEFHKPINKVRVNRLSRHLYDVFQLANSAYISAIEDRKLYNTIIQHRYQFTKVSGIDYNLLAPNTLNFIPINEVTEGWEKDYKKMREEMIYQENAPTFDEILERLYILKKQINTQEWKLDKQYPKP